MSIQAPPDNPRLMEIARCCDELAAIRRDRDPRDAFPRAVGELDQLAELHRLLYS